MKNKILTGMLLIAGLAISGQQKFAYLTYDQEIAKAASDISAKDNRPGFTHHIGEYFGGGIIISLWSSNGTEHGLIVGLVDLYPYNADSIYRTGAPIPGVSWQSADSLCKVYKGGGYNDWQLPNKSELDTINQFNKIICHALGNVGHKTSLFMKGNYWSSTLNDRDKSGGSAWGEVFNTIHPNYDGSASPLDKNEPGESVRPIRKF